MAKTAPTLIDGNDRRPARSRARSVRLAAAMAGSLISASSLALPASAQQRGPVVVAPPFIATLSNTTPLAFGMDALQAERALGMPLNYVSGRRGDEIFLAIRTGGGSGFFNRRDRLYLQFRHGRLTGWKGDWGRNWMWD
ncbi:hypothetical protein ACTZWT_21170 [Rhodopseudomonas sp. NSM]|uniref:hypothetical protein n=1 Tax=Rhodopseudomonas sp. NSM TaxID=3457630 RepID=UPI0040371CD5